MGQELAAKYKMDFAEISTKTRDNFEKVLTDFVLDIASCKKVMIPLKDIYMQFLLHLNDDDLLMNCIGLLID